jgi:IclR family transcriptional regulator, pca regulon regulatory protein
LRDNRANIDLHTPSVISKADFIEGAAKSLAVLESFDVNRQRLNATQTASRTGLTRAAARRHLLTLAHLGYLESDGQHFWLAHRVLRLAGSYLASARLPRAVRAELSSLSQATGDTYCVAVLDGYETVIVATSGERWGAEELAPFGAHLGARMPAFCTSTGRVMLAALPPAALKWWLRDCEPIQITSKTVVQKTKIAALIAQARLEDFSYACDEHELGVHAISVPLRDTSGRCVAALNRVGYTNTSTREQLKKKILPLLQRSANQLRALV